MKPALTSAMARAPTPSCRQELPPQRPPHHRQRAPFGSPAHRAAGEHVKGGAAELALRGNQGAVIEGASACRHHCAAALADACVSKPLSCADAAEHDRVAVFEDAARLASGQDDRLLAAPRVRKCHEQTTRQFVQVGE